MKRNRKIDITSLIASGFAAILVLVTLMAFQYSSSLHQLKGVTQDLYVHPFLVSNSTMEVKTNIFQLRAGILSYVFLAQNHRESRAYLTPSDDLENRIYIDLAIIKANFLGNLGQVRQLENSIREWMAIRKKVIAAADSGDIQRAERIINSEGTPKYAEIMGLVDYVLHYARNRAKLYVQDANEQADQILDQVFVFTITIIAFLIASSALVLWRVNYLQKVLEHQAKFDYLTGIPNRRYFMETAEYELQKSHRYHSDVALAIADLDFFKRINDQYGHDAGDEALKVFCETCQLTLRSTDTMARIGGEEFAFILPNTALSEAKAVLERVRHAIEEKSVRLTNNESIRITASFGLTINSQETLTVDQLVRKADQALYHAKESGRNCLCSAV
jgi:diguanylate cyclase (GGDEF)-like protein